MPTKASTLETLPALMICCAASVTPMECPITSIFPVQEDAIALLMALRTGVSSEPLWSLLIIRLLPHLGRKIWLLE